MTLSLEDAKNLEVGTILYHISNTNADGSPQRWKVNGKVKTWKRSPDRVQIPIKHGMYDFDYITENDLSLVALDESEIVLAKNVCSLGFDS